VLPVISAVLIAVGVTAALYLAAVVVLIALGRRGDARALVRFVPDCIVLFKRLLGDPRVPWWSKALLALVIGYVAMPFDLVPDFIPVAGQLDDVILVSLVLRVVLRATDDAVLRELWPGPERSLATIRRPTALRP
jgi:uncharacterized membrane protein YkvA (DUF1232 family)